jgi:hypothetical protein
MKRNLIIGLNLGSLSIFLAACNFWNNLFLFLLVGAIPGTSNSLSPLVMLIIMLGAMTLLGYTVRNIMETKQNRGSSLPKKRYGRI